jgi:hypothetical protein
MKRFRFTIANLLIIVLFLGIAFAALREASDIWDSAVFSLVQGTVLLSILRAIHGTGGGRAFWLGFAICGGAYLWLSVMPLFEFRLVTTHALLYVDSKLPGRPGLYEQLIGGAGGYVQQTAFDPVFADTPQPTILNVTNRPWALWTAQSAPLPLHSKTVMFIRIGHSLLAVIAGCVGGSFSVYWYARQQRVPVPSAPVPASDSTSGGGAAPSSE